MANIKISKNTIYVTLPQHVLFLFGVYLVFTDNVNWKWLIVTYVFWVIIGYLGFSVFYHRYFAHRAFQMSLFWENFWALIGILSGRGSPINMASHHCGLHHPYADTDKDPQSPIKGKLWSWYLWSETHQFKVVPQFVKHLMKNKFIVFLDRNYLKVFWALSLIIFILNWKIGIFGVMGAGVLHFHIEGAVSTFCHLNNFGKQDFDTKDNSRNIRGIFNLFILGTGLHNNHHAFPKEYHYEKLKGDFDLARYVVPVFIKK